MAQVVQPCLGAIPVSCVMSSRLDPFLSNGRAISAIKEIRECPDKKFLANLNHTLFEMVSDSTLLPQNLHNTFPRTSGLFDNELSLDDSLESGRPRDSVDFFPVDDLDRFPIKDIEEDSIKYKANVYLTSSTLSTSIPINSSASKMVETTKRELLSPTTEQFLFQNCGADNSEIELLLEDSQQNDADSVVDETTAATNSISSEYVGDCANAKLSSATTFDHLFGSPSQCAVSRARKRRNPSVPEMGTENSGNGRIIKLLNEPKFNKSRHFSMPEYSFEETTSPPSSFPSVPKRQKMQLPLNNTFKSLSVLPLPIANDPCTVPSFAEEVQVYTTDDDVNNNDAFCSGGVQLSRDEEYHASRYRERRDKNNEASRASRLKRKEKDKAKERELAELKNENVDLINQVDRLSHDVALLKKYFLLVLKHDQKAAARLQSSLCPQACPLLD